MSCTWKNNRFVPVSVPLHPNRVTLLVTVALLLLVAWNVAFEHALDERLHVPQIIRVSESLEARRA
jgi:hypothetical protein